MAVRNNYPFLLIFNTALFRCSLINNRVIVYLALGTAPEKCIWIATVAAPFGSLEMFFTEKIRVVIDCAAGWQAA